MAFCWFPSMRRETNALRMWRWCNKTGSTYLQVVCFDVERVYEDVLKMCYHIIVDICYRSYLITLK
jgi:hypothetical protein